MKAIEVWKPKYSTREVFVATHKIKSGWNYIEITQDSAYEGKLLKIDGEEARKWPTKENGRGMVYMIPLGRFEIIDKDNEKK